MPTLVELASQIVTSMASTTAMTTEEVFSALDSIHCKLGQLESGPVPEAAIEGKPVISLEEAFKEYEVLCMICGRGGFKTLTRHLKLAHQLRPDAYRRRFGIPSGQSLSALNYAEVTRQTAMDRALASTSTRPGK